MCIALQLKMNTNILPAFMFLKTPRVLNFRWLTYNVDTQCVECLFTDDIAIYIGLHLQYTWLVGNYVY